MKLVSTRPFWPIRDGLPATYPELKDHTRADVAVIGAGVSGAFLALHLAEAGFDTLVLDRRDVAHGSTAASTGLLQYELDEPLHRLAARFGDEFAIRCYRRCHRALDGIAQLVRRLDLACDFERRPSLLVASERAHLPRLRREYEARVAAGFKVDWWPRSKVAAESSLPHPAAIRSRDGAQVDAYRLTHGLLAAAQRAGARIFDRTAVTQRRFHSRGVILHTEGGPVVRARNLVVATGYEAEEFLHQKITALHSTFAVVSEPVDSLAGWPSGRCLIWETARPYCYLRTTADQRVMMGGYDEPFRDPVARDRMLPVKCAALVRRFRQLFPKIDFEVATAWAGTFANTEAGLPFIGRHPELPHTWLALGLRRQWHHIQPDRSRGHPRRLGGTCGSRRAVIRFRAAGGGRLNRVPLLSRRATFWARGLFPARAGRGSSAPYRPRFFCNRPDR